MLAAVLFTDIVGYSSKMGQDEERTMDLIRKNRKIHKTIIRKHHGKWHKEIGDGTLSSFPTISDAVYCAGEVLKRCSEENITLRIGIHQGEIVRDNGDIFGDVINIASRIESCTKPGKINVSCTVYANVKNRHAISAKYLGKKSLRNISDRIRIYELTINKNFSPHQSPSHPYSKLVAAASLSFLLLSFCSTALGNEITPFILL